MDHDPKVEERKWGIIMLVSLAPLLAFGAWADFIIVRGFIRLFL